MKKHEFHRTFDAKVQRREMVKNEFGRRPVAIYEVWVVTVFDEKLMAKWFQQISKMEPLGAHS